MSAITHLFAGVPVSDLETSIDWYTRFFGRARDNRVGDEVFWEIDEHAWLFIEPNATRAGAGAGRITLAEPPDAASASTRSSEPGLRDRCLIPQQREEA